MIYVEHMHAARAKPTQEAPNSIYSPTDTARARNNHPPPGQTTMLRMGYPRTAVLPNSCVDAEPDSNAAYALGPWNRSSTDMHLSERSTGTSSFSQAAKPVPILRPHLQNPYQYEWYRLLTLLIGVHTSTIIVCLIASFAMASWFRIATIPAVFRSIGWMIFAMVVWTSTCVLAEAMQPVINDCTLRFPEHVRKVKHKIFRGLWILWYICIFCGVAFLIILSVFPYVAPITNRGIDK